MNRFSLFVFMTLCSSVAAETILVVPTSAGGGGINGALLEAQPGDTILVPGDDSVWPADSYTELITITTSNLTFIALDDVMIKGPTGDCFTAADTPVRIIEAEGIQFHGFTFNESPGASCGTPGHPSSGPVSPEAVRIEGSEVEFIDCTLNDVTSSYSEVTFAESQVYGSNADESSLAYIDCEIASTRAESSVIFMQGCNGSSEWGRPSSSGINATPPYCVQAYPGLTFMRLIDTCLAGTECNFSSGKGGDGFECRETLLSDPFNFGGGDGGTVFTLDATSSVHLSDSTATAGNGGNSQTGAGGDGGNVFMAPQNAIIVLNNTTTQAGAAGTGSPAGVPGSVIFETEESSTADPLCFSSEFLVHSTVLGATSYGTAFPEEGDANSDSMLDVADVVYLE